SEIILAIDIAKLRGQKECNAFFHMSQIFQTISNMQSKIDLMTGIAFVSMDICYMFFGNYLGQKIMNHSIDFFHQTYNSVWYDAPLNAQKQLLFVMQRSTKETTLLFGGIFVPSLEGFATIQICMGKIEEDWSVPKQEGVGLEVLQDYSEVGRTFAINFASKMRIKFARTSI
ncbi:hypothetical protein KM043_002463, partial [Ampulex compressa]